MKKILLLCALSLFAAGTAFAASNQTGEYKNGFTGDLIFDDETEDQVDTSSNQLTISGGAFDGDIITGQSQTGSALENELRLVGGDISSANLKAGVSQEKDASKNSVLLENVTVQGNVTAGEAAGTDGGDASDNKVTIYNSTINYNAAEPNKVIAGSSQSGIVSGNEIYLEKNSVLGTTAAAGYSDGAGEVSYNTVRVYDGSNITDASGNGAVYGGYSAEGAVYNNQITLYDAGTVDADLYGGYAGKANASLNLVEIKKGTVNSNVYGGYAAEGSVSGNEVRLQGGTFAGTIAGGWANTTGSASGNKVTVNGEVVLNGTNLYGGYGVNADALNNRVVLETASVGDKVYGGYSEESNAQGNTLSVKGASQGGSILAAGWSNANTASKNSLSIADSSFSVTDGLYGAYGDQQADNNALSIANSTLTGTFYGGYSLQGAAQGNAFSASGSTLTGNVYGGYGAAEASGNTVTLDNVTVNGDVYGGYASAGSDTITNNNTVILSGKTVVNGNFYGGNGTTAQGNSLVLRNYDGTINAVNAFDNVTLYGLNSNVTFTQDINNVGVVLYGKPTEVSQTIAYTPNNSSFSLNRDVLGAYSYTIEGVNQGAQTAWNVKGKYQNELAKSYAQAQLAYLMLATQGDEMLEAIFNQSMQRDETDDTFVNLQYYDNEYDADSTKFDLNSFTAQAGRWFRAGESVWGLFAQYSHGQYDTDILSAEGNADSFALGGFWLLPYSDQGRFEAVLRAGYQQGDFSSEENFSDLDKNSWYGGASAGLVQNISALQLYGKFNWLYLAGDNVNDNLDQNINFKDTQSLTGRFGARLDLGTWAKRYKPYLGVSGIYEFDAESNVSVDGHRVNDVDLGGLTGQAEIGVTYENAEALMPIKSSLSVFGLTGQAKGWGANIRLNFSF